jgi:hypothetical protein
LSADEWGFTAMSMPGPENALDHVGLIMFENRSSDNSPGEENM